MINNRVLNKSLFGLIFLFILIGCKSNIEPKQYCIYIFIDITDSTFNNPNIYTADFSNLIEYIKTSETGDSVSYDGHEIKLFIFNDISENRSKTIKLEKGNPGLMGEGSYVRTDKLRQFYSKLNSEFNALLGTIEFNKGSSKIYQNLCRELSEMMDHEADKRIVIIYSDMLENSQLFSFYRNDQFLDSCIQNIEYLDKQFENTDCCLPDLTGMDIHVIAHRTPENDKMVNKAQKFWTKLFEFKKSKVRFNTELYLK